MFNALESIFPFKFQFNVFSVNKYCLYYCESTEVSFKYNPCKRPGFFTKLFFFPLFNTEIFEWGHMNNTEKMMHKE